MATSGPATSRSSGVKKGKWVQPSTSWSIPAACSGARRACTTLRAAGVSSSPDSTRSTNSGQTWVTTRTSRANWSTTLAKSSP